MTPSSYVVVAGHICLDIFPGMAGLDPEGFARSFQPGHLIEVGDALMSTGGPVSNTGLALHKLGIPTRLMCKLGQDPFGAVVRDRVESFDPRLAAGMVVDPAVPTSYTLILSPPGVDRIFLHCPGANNRFSVADIDLDLVGGASLFHFGYPPLMRQMYIDGGEGLIALYRQVKATGVTTSLDLCYPDPASEGGKADWRSILYATLPEVDLFVPSIEELLMTLRPATFARMAGDGPVLAQVTPALLHDLSDELLGLGVKLAAIKLGERGLYLRTGSRAALDALNPGFPIDRAAWTEHELWAPCFQVGVVGTTGAGDATIAGLLAGLLRGLSPEEAVTLAVAVGACNVEAADALSGLRSWEETRARVRAGWARLPLALRDPGWTWDPEHELWRAK